MRRGEVYWTNFPIQRDLSDDLEIEGAEQYGERPAIVLYSDRLVKHTQTIVVIPITTSMRFRNRPSGLFLPKGEASLQYDSVALAHQIRAVDKRRLGRFIGVLSPEYLEVLGKMVSSVLGLKQ